MRRGHDGQRHSLIATQPVQAVLTMIDLLYIEAVKTGLVQKRTWVSSSVRRSQSVNLAVSILCPPRPVPGRPNTPSWSWKRPNGALNEKGQRIRT